MKVDRQTSQAAPATTMIAMASGADRTIASARRAVGDGERTDRHHAVLAQTGAHSRQERRRDQRAASEPGKQQAQTT